MRAPPFIQRGSRPDPGPFFTKPFIRPALLFLVVLLTAANLQVRAGDLEDCQKLYRQGRYADCIQKCEAKIKSRSVSEEWPLLLTQCLRQTGQYDRAEQTITKAVADDWRSLRLRVLGYHVLRENGKVDEAASLLDQINSIGRSRSDDYRDPASSVALGQAALIMGADAKLVLENFFNPARKASPEMREAHLAIGNLFLDKNDFQLAAKNLELALEKFPDDPDVHYALAQAYAPSARRQMVAHLEAALQENDHHVPSLLMIADQAVDAEEYAEVEKNVAKVLEVNPDHPEAWSYRAVLAHLRNQPEEEGKARDRAMAHWKTNPRVDFLIGEKLSQKYRFLEGSQYQRRALGFDRNYLPAKIQLAQDVLRLGEEAEGWTLAKEVHDRDGYDIAAYNLLTLHDTLEKFVSLSAPDFLVRMHPREAPIYGNRAMTLLQKARETLGRKYGYSPEKPTTVEIFPEQKDFAIRTFGMPGGEGYLGVCFGHVITANSPASQTAQPSNWEAVLWHEYCHVVTLGLTKNKMPRWLSEGISVFEERQANPVWGQVMTPRYRQMVLKGELTKISELSGAFLSPKTPQHLQFAYYESSLVVEFIVQKYGLDSIKRILADLGAGRDINAAIESHSMGMSSLEKEFAAFAKSRAEQLGTDLDWEPPATGRNGINPLDAANADRNYYKLLADARKLLTEKKWEEAKVPLQKVIAAYPDDRSPESAYVMLAAACRGLKEVEQERAALLKVASLDADAVGTFQRLMEMDGETGNWSSVRENAERYLAVNPLTPQPYAYLARAAESTGKTSVAIDSLETVLRLDPPDPSEVHYTLAKLLAPSDKTKARRHVLESLEEAPRYRDALGLLLKLKEEKPSEPGSQPASEGAAVPKAPPAQPAP